MRVDCRSLLGCYQRWPCLHRRAVLIAGSRFPDLSWCKSAAGSLPDCGSCSRHAVFLLPSLKFKYWLRKAYSEMKRVLLLLLFIYK